MKTKVIVSLCALFLVVSASALFADEIWQGNAAVSVRGELDRDGYYAASNSFPPGTKILVTNLDNGRRVIVTVKQRLNGSSNVFLLLSANAAGELGMKSTDVIRIKSQVVGISTDLTGGIDLVQNKDMDTNPTVGTPDLGPNVLAETSPQPSPTPSTGPSPSPSPVPSVSPTPTPALTETTPEPGLEKDRFSRPSVEQEGELSARRSPTPSAEETAGNVKLTEARVALKERGEAVIVSRPQEGSESGKGEVVAILIEPKAVAKPDRTPRLTDLERPALPDRETIELALNDPTLREKEKPFIYVLHGLTPAGEATALASQDLPEVGRREKPEVDDYAKAVQESDRLALETHDLPEVQQGEKADVTGLAKVQSEKERLALETYNLPEVQQGEKADVTGLAKTQPAEEKTELAKNLLPQVQGPEKPDLLTRTEPGGKDKKSVDLALVPTNPNPPKKTGETRTVVTTQPEHTTQTTRVEPENHTAVTATVWDNTAAFSKNYYYLQLGVFTTRGAAEKILRAYPTYPMLIVSGKADNADVFKVVVGPLKRDETGTVLYLFKARGYRDAFLRYIE